MGDADGGRWRLRFFGWRGSQNCFFLKTVSDAQAIRQRVLEQFERAALPHYTDDERRKMLSFVIVGGGPTGRQRSRAAIF